MFDGVRLSGLIESPKNERIRRYRRLRKRNFRYREGQFLVEGLQSVAEALFSPHKPECIICNQRGMDALAAYADVIDAGQIPCFSATDEVIESLAATVTPQGIMAVSPLLHVDMEKLLDTEPGLLLVANRVRDPGNLGNMIRIADAAGAGGMVICRESADPYNAKTVRSTAGSIFHLPLAVGEDINEVTVLLRRSGYAIYAADAHDGQSIWEAQWPDKLALIMGNEAWGIPREEEVLADGLVKVPIYGKAESLNVAAATAVLLYEVRRRQALGKRKEVDK